MAPSATTTLKFLLLAKNEVSPAMNAAGRDSEKAGGKLSGVAKKGGVALAGLGVAAAAFATSSVDKFEEVTLESRGLQRALGGTLSEASRWREAAKLSGVDSDVFTKSLQKLDKGLITAAGSQKSSAAMAKTLGMSFQDAHGKVLPMDQLLPKLSDKFKNMPDGADKTALAMKLFGKAGVSMLPFLGKGSAGIADLMKQSDKFGTTLQDNAIDKVAEAKKSQREWGATMDGLKIQLGAGLLPILEAFTVFIRAKVIPAIQAITGFVQRHQKGFEQLLVVLQKVFQGVYQKIVLPILKALIPVIVSIIGWLKQHQAGIEQTGKVIAASLVVAVKILIGVLKVVIGVIVDVVKVFIGLYNTVAGVVRFFAGVPGKIAAIFTSAANWLKSAGQALLTGLFTAMNFYWKYYVGTWLKIGATIANWFKNAADWLYNSGSSIIHGLFRGFRAAWDLYVGTWRSIGSTIKGWVSNAADWLYNSGSSIIHGLFRGFRAAWDLYVGTWRSIGSTIKGWVSNAADWLYNSGSSIIHGLFRGFRAAWDLYVGTWRSIGSTIKGWFSGAGDWIKSSGQALMAGFWKGMKAGAGNVGDFIGDIGAAIKTGLNNLLHLPIKIPHINTHIPGVGTVGGETLIPRLAQGTGFFAGGPVLVGDRGPEILNLPPGSGVTSATSTASKRRMDDGDGLTVNLTMPGQFYGSKEEFGRAAAAALEHVVNARGVKIGIARGIR